MQITLPPEAQAIIDRKLATGEYASEEDVIVSALTLLESDDIPSMPHDTLATALDQIERGQTVPWTDDFMDRAWGQARENSRLGKPVRDNVTY